MKLFWVRGIGKVPPIVCKVWIFLDLIALIGILIGVFLFILDYDRFLSSSSFD
jgi:hypothetical protein